VGNCPFRLFSLILLRLPRSSFLFSRFSLTIFFRIGIEVCWIAVCFSLVHHFFLALGPEGRDFCPGYLHPGGFALEEQPFFVGALEGPGVFHSQGVDDYGLADLFPDFVLHSTYENRFPVKLQMPAARVQGSSLKHEFEAQSGPPHISGL